MKTLYLLKLILLLTITFFLFSTGTSQVLISGSTGNPDNSAMLEIQSNSKGVLIPRLTTAERNGISTPAEGLLVYDSNLQSFFIYGKKADETVGWYNVSDHSSIWSKKDTMVYLSQNNYNVGIGTKVPNKKLVIQADNDNDTLLEVLNKDGYPLVVITPKLTKFNFIEGEKGISGGFAIGRFSSAKGEKALSDTALFLVTPDSTRVYTSGATGVSGGFAVGRFSSAKGKYPGRYKYFFTDIDSTRVYTQDDTKGVAGGFAVGRFSSAKGDLNKFFFTNLDSTTINIGDSTAGLKVINTESGSEESFVRMTTENSFLGHESGIATIPGGAASDNGKYNSFIGYRTGYQNSIGKRNVFIGHLAGFSNNDNYNVFIGNEAGYSNTTGTYNLFIGYRSGTSNTTGNYNSFFGYQSGRENISGIRNVFIGPSSGRDNIEGDNNLFLGYQSGMNNEKGNSNIYMGYQAGYNDTTGNYNLFLGYRAGRSNRNGSSNICLGYQAGYSELGSDRLYIANSNTTRPIIWGNMNLNKLGFHGSVCIGDTLNGGGTNVLGIVNGTVPSSSVTNGIILYSQDVSSFAELRVRDEAGNISTLSPHNFSLIKKSEPMAWSFYSENSETGQVINVDMLRAVRLIEEISGEKLVYMNKVDKTVTNEDKTKEKSYVELIKEQQKLIEQLSNEVEQLRSEQEKMKEILKSKSE